MAEMKRTWLIQRLHKPHTNQTGLLGKFKDNPFSFGGGMVNGGLSPEAMDLIRPLCSFDYMGAAEFEFGEVPRAFQKIASYEKDLIAFSFKGTRKLDKGSWSSRMWLKRDPKAVIPEKVSAEIYVLCHKDHKEGVLKAIKEDLRNKLQLKEWTMLAQVLEDTIIPSDYPNKTVGWLELDNGFMFFTDHTMWEGFCQLFEHKEGV